MPGVQPTPVPDLPTACPDVLIRGSVTDDDVAHLLHALFEVTETTRITLQRAVFDFPTTRARHPDQPWVVQITAHLAHGPVTLLAAADSRPHSIDVLARQLRAHLHARLQAPPHPPDQTQSSAPSGTTTGNRGS